MTYILILFVTVGALSGNDSMALTNAPGFAAIAECEAAGKAAVSKFSEGTKRAAYVCVAQKR